MSKEAHEHKFVIPVEWKFQFWGKYNVSSVSEPHPREKVVTRLMCECGEERNRGTK